MVTRRRKVDIWIFTPKGWKRYGNLTEAGWASKLGTYSLSGGVITIHLATMDVRASVFYIEEKEE